MGLQQPVQLVGSHTHEPAEQCWPAEHALFVPTGSMGNQLCVKLHTKPGTEVICEERSHIYNYEMGGAARSASMTQQRAP